MYTLHKQITQSKSNQDKVITLLTALTAFTMILAPKAYGQGTVTLHSPLVPGSSQSIARRTFTPWCYSSDRKWTNVITPTCRYDRTPPYIIAVYSSRTFQ